MILLLISIMAYVLTVIGFFFIVLYEEKKHCNTVGDVLDFMKDTPFFIPIVNTIFLLVWSVLYIVVSLELHNPFVNLWNKIRNIKLK